VLEFVIGRVCVIGCVLLVVCVCVCVCMLELLLCIAWLTGTGKKIQSTEC
jgi:hypothetical protein